MHSTSYWAKAILQTICYTKNSKNEVRNLAFTRNFKKHLRKSHFYLIGNIYLAFLEELRINGITNMSGITYDQYDWPLAFHPCWVNLSFTKTAVSCTEKMLCRKFYSFRSNSNKLIGAKTVEHRDTTFRQIFLLAFIINLIWLSEFDQYLKSHWICLLILQP